MLYINLMVITNEKSRYTYQKKKSPNIILKLVSSQEKRAKEERNKNNYKNNPKAVNEMTVSTLINNYIKHKWTVYSSLKT